MTFDARPDLVLTASEGAAATSEGAGMDFMVRCADAAAAARMNEASIAVNRIGDPFGRHSTLCYAPRRTSLAPRCHSIRGPYLRLLLAKSVDGGMSEHTRKVCAF